MHAALFRNREADGGANGELADKALGISETANDRIDETTETVKKGTEAIEKAGEKVETATEFLVSVADKLTRNDNASFFDVVEAAVPWIESTAEVVGEALPPVKAALKVVGFLTKENDPRALGLLAFSLAYQSALAASVKAIKDDPATDKAKIGQIHGKKLKPAVKASQDSLEGFEKFRLETCFSHPLMTRMDSILDNVAEVGG
jgi:hypothetical protein